MLASARFSVNACWNLRVHSNRELHSDNRFSSVKLPLDQFQTMPANAAAFQPHINRRIRAGL